MSAFGYFFLHQVYVVIASRGDPLKEIAILIDWDRYRPLLLSVIESDPT